MPSELRKSKLALGTQQPNLSTKPVKRYRKPYHRLVIQCHNVPYTKRLRLSLTVTASQGQRVFIVDSGAGGVVTEAVALAQK